MRQLTTPSSSALRMPARAAAVALAVIAIGACSNNVQVRTETAPGVLFTGRHTFRILETPAPHGVTLEATDPMMNNSITNRALRDAIRRALVDRGYTPAYGGGADLDVAYYAAANRVLDLRTFDYGYTWRGWPRERTEVTSYEQGTVLIDLIDPSNHQLLWRGQGKAAVSTNPEKYNAELQKEAEAIIKKMPTAM